MPTTGSISTGYAHFIILVIYVLVQCDERCTRNPWRHSPGKQQHNEH